MKKLLLVLTALTILISAPAFAIEVKLLEDQGRYQGVESTEKKGVYIVDTKTGKVKFCYNVALGPVHAPQCTPWSQ